MFKHIPSGVTFENRKQAITLMGRKLYKRALFNGDFEFIEKPKHYFNLTTY